MIIILQTPTFAILKCEKYSLNLIAFISKAFLLSRPAIMIA